MFSKLLALLLQSKTAAITGVFVFGTAGALVSATTQNGITTITVTPTTQTDETKAPASPAVLLTPLSSPATLTPSASPSACADEAHIRADAVRTVNAEFKQDHNGLVQLARVNKTSKDAETLRTADRLVTEIRQAGVKAIHATNTCEDNDKDEHEDADKAEAQNDNDNDENDKDEVHAAKSDEHHTTSDIKFSSTDPKGIADEAVAAMKLAFTTAKNSVTTQVTTPTSPRTPEPKKHDDRSGDRKGHDTKGHDDN